MKDIPALHRAIQNARTSVIVLVSLLFCACQPSPDPLAPVQLSVGALQGSDVIVITLDTTRRDHIGCYGAQATNTPNIDKICAAGVRLDQAAAVAPITLPTHSSMFTGLYPPRHGVRYNGEYRLAQEQQTLAETLQAQGYQTAAFVSAFVLNRRFGLAQGFDHFDDTVSPLAGAFSSNGNERDAVAVTDAALAYLENRDPERPLFLWVHYFDAHFPYLGHSSNDANDDALRYRGEVAHVDAQLGRLLRSATLKPDQSLLMLLADHGESLGAHGERTHGLFVYDSTVWIPWIVRAPGLRASHSSAPTSQIDLMPTVLDALGMDLPENMDGQSLLTAARSPDQSVYMEATQSFFEFRLSALHALRTPSAKYIAAPRPEFYRLDSDSQEANNLLAANDNVAESSPLSERLDGLLLTWPALDATPVAEHGDDAEVVARLRSLGYLSGSDLGMELGDPKDAVQLIEAHKTASDAAASGRLDEALALLDASLAVMPNVRGSLYLRARVLAALGRTGAAERDIASVNATRPNADSLLLQAQLWILTKRYDDARALIREAVRLDPHHGGALIVEGDLAVVAQDFAAARAAYEKALQVDGLRIGQQAKSRLARLPRPR